MATHKLHPSKITDKLYVHTHVCTCICRLEDNCFADNGAESLDMLPDVGIDGEVCIHRALKLTNLDLGGRMSWYTPPCSYTLSASWFFHAAT